MSRQNRFTHIGKVTRSLSASGPSEFEVKLRETRNCWLSSLGHRFRKDMNGYSENCQLDLESVRVIEDDDGKSREGAEC